MISGVKKILGVFLILLAVFFTAWGVKARALPERPESSDDTETSNWWESDYTSAVSEDWVLDSTVEDNYIPVPGKENYFYVVDDDGTVIKTRKRIKDVSTGEWIWEDVDENTDGMECVDKEKGIYKTKDENGKTKYVKYIRNKDNTYAFVDVDKDGNYLNMDTDASKTDSKHKLEDGNEGLYGLYNDDGVRIGTTKKTKDSDGNSVWVLVDDKDYSANVGNDGKDRLAELAQEGNSLGSENKSADSGEDGKTVSSDGSYTVKTTETTSETKDGYKIIYQTTVVKKYDSSGNLLSSKSSDPVEISKTRLVGSDATPNESDIASTLDGEVSRMTGKVTLNTQKANDILSALNAQRKKNGVPELKMSTGSDIYKIAEIRAASMAVYNHASNSDPLYGTTSDICSRYGVSLTNPVQNMLKTSTASASEIHTRFQATDSSRTVRMSSAYSKAGIAVVDQDGVSYVIEIFAQ